MGMRALPLNDALFPASRALIELGVEQLQNDIQRDILPELPRLHVMAWRWFDGHWTAACHVHARLFLRR
jgi:hypothetical protein